MPYVTIGDNRFFYQIAEPNISTHVPLVCIHGSGGDSRVWDMQLMGLAGHCRTIALDLPGHGRSLGHASDAVQAYALWLDQFVLALGLKSFILAGHSLGGAVTQEYARQHPQKVAGIVLAGTGMTFTVPQDYLNLLERDFEAAVRMSCARAYADPAAAGRHGHGYSMLMHNGKKALVDDLLACSRFDSSAWISSVQAPALVVCGSEDALSPCADSQALSDHLPQATMHVINGAGHMTMLEVPDRVNDLVVRFIKSRGATAGS